jgi:formamidopyrimidine-DNA glycosylase
MTGQLTIAPAADPEPDHLHLTLALSGGTELRFRDVRRFGSATLYPDEAAAAAVFAGLGPEPFGLDPAYFRDALAGTSRNLKAVLLDQRVVAGVGNIYADEACALARLHPGRRADSLTRAEADRLREAVEAVLTAAIAGRGSTIRDYVGGSGLRGEFQTAHRVYGRTGEPCGTCRTAVACVRLAGRSSHYCPKCQGVGYRVSGIGKKSAATRSRAGPG